jgi:predicted kinase
MCGTPGAGKTTWVRTQIQKSSTNSVHISRDVIRFGLLSDGEDYFAKEDLVFDTFCQEVQKAIGNSGIEHIFVDATHLNEKSRNKTLDKLNLDGVKLHAVNFEIPVEVCLSQNENRKNDGRAYVPRSVIRRMSAQFVPAREQGEKYSYNIITIKMEDDDE